MPDCLYLRKSRLDIEAEARGEGETLARHEKILLDLARRLKRNITHIYREVVSGETIASRPEMQQLLTDVEQGIWDAVLVVEVERLARGDTIDQGIVAQTFKYANTKIITPVKTYDPTNEFDEEFFEFGLFMSRREYKTTNRRLQQGRVQSVKEGKYVGNKPPYGFLRQKLDKQKGYILIPHPEQADVVRMIFDLYIRAEDKMGVSLICRRLNDLQISPQKGDAWVPATIRGILSNPVYIGKVRWNSRPVVKKMIDGQVIKERPRAKPEDWVLVDGLHEPLIVQTTFDLAQKYLAENPSRPCPKDFTPKNPLAGLIVCGICGRHMIRRPYTLKGKPDSLMCPATACKNISCQLSFVEDRLLLALEEWLKQYKLTWETPESNGNESKNRELAIKKKAVKKLEDELKTLDKQMDQIHDLLEQGVYSTDTFISRSKTISKRMTAAKEHKKTLLKELRMEELRDKNQRIIIPKVEEVLKLYQTTDDPAVKNKLLFRVVDKAVYLKTLKGHWRRGGMDEFALTLYPKQTFSKLEDD